MRGAFIHTHVIATPDSRPTTTQVVGPGEKGDEREIVFELA